MSLITRCPACGTMFKVVPDQLRISEGWVRCGHCSDVFDASAHLMPEGASAVQESQRGQESRPDEQYATTAESSEAGAATMVESRPLADAAAESADDFESSIHTGIGDDVASADVEAAELEAEARALRETPLDAPFVLLREDPAVEIDQTDEKVGTD